jgi:hypothetical protein
MFLAKSLQGNQSYTREGQRRRPCRPLHHTALRRAPAPPPMERSLPECSRVHRTPPATNATSRSSASHGPLERCSASDWPAGSRRSAYEARFTDSMSPSDAQSSSSSSKPTTCRCRCASSSAAAATAAATGARHHHSPLSPLSLLLLWPS